MIAWVAAHRLGCAYLTDDDLRRIELCAMTTLDVSMFSDLHGVPHAPAPEVQDER